MTVAQLKVKSPPKPRSDIVTLTPEEAMELLEHNTLNRPLSQPHVARIVAQILGGHWRFNGDTIKIAEGGDIVDGQHRLWACVESKRPIETIIVRGVAREAFATIDTLRKPRNGADILSLNGVNEYRRETALALTWLIRWQRRNGEAPRGTSRVENAEIETAYAHHPKMVTAAERARKAVYGLASPGMIAFLYYVFASHNQDIADRFIRTLEDPAGCSVSDPFFRFRKYLSADKPRRMPVVTIALAIKAANAAKVGRKVDALTWKNQGEHAEAFPKLDI